MNYTVYTLGFHDNKPVIVTILLIGETDMSDYKRRPVNYVMPFFQRHLVNCGKFESILSFDESVRYENATLSIDGPSDTAIHITKGKYFNIPDYNYAKGTGLATYPYKHCVVNSVRNYVGENYTGTINKFFEGGGLYKRICYLKGEIMNEKIYRNVAFNTLQCFLRYKDGKVDYARHYDEQERLLGSAYYSDGNIYHSSDLPPPSYLLELAELPFYVEQTKEDEGYDTWIEAGLEPGTTAETGVEEVEEEDDDDNDKDKKLKGHP